MPLAHFHGISDFQLERSGLFVALTEMRVFKLDMEVEIMRYCARVAASAHIRVLQAVRYVGFFFFLCVWGVAGRVIVKVGSFEGRLHGMRSLSKGSWILSGWPLLLWPHLASV